MSDIQFRIVRRPYILKRSRKSMEELTMLSDGHEKSMQALEWNFLLQRLAQQTCSPLGAERCYHLPLAEQLEVAQHRMQETTEMRRLQESDEPFPILQFQDLRPALTRAEKGASLDAPELRDFKCMLELGERVKQYVTRFQQEVPALYAYITSLEDLSWLIQKVSRCIDSDGHILESASPTLHRLFQETHHLKQRIRQRLESILASKQFEEILQEHYFALRGGRYVLPVRTDMQHRLPGIVHDVSASGATVFLEPRELVEYNNQLKVAELHLSQESQRILQELSQCVSAQATVLTRYLDTLGEFDAIAAKGKLSRLMHGTWVALNEKGVIRLRHACHPLLVLTGREVVPNDLELEIRQRVLVISGPNTGGKTVTLKFLGLFAFMVRAGLHLPCGEGSEMGFFPNIYADIGDAQDLNRDLSSFSAHITELIHLMKVAPTNPAPVFPRTLVLLDEVVGSTDPTEGAALAAVLLQRFASLGFKVVVTTHYNALKVLALNTACFVNASLEFDVHSLVPTYRLLQGIPGGSSAIDISRRLGMEEDLLEQALNLVDHDVRRLSVLFAELHQLRVQLRRELQGAEQRHLEAEEASREVREISERLRVSEREEQRKVKKKLLDELHRARSDIHMLLAEIKKEKSVEKVKDSKAQLATLEKGFMEAIGLPSTRIPPDQLQEGDWVEIVNLQTKGRLLESPQGKKRVRVRIGDAEVSVGVSLIDGLNPADFTPLEPMLPSQSRRQSKGWHLDRTRVDQDIPFTQSLDLRGCTVEESLTRVLEVLDKATVQEVLTLRLIHGQGTGRLKAAIREFVSSSPYIVQYRPGNKEEGGDGVTIVSLR